eukprot:TRINITY_DN3645_c0_g1_i5.p1 TRINITY_DN3645_c0_g1~~TRINITY_DN3645_c0_g1_i5.p1  ORF type:complete len:511 (+),score=93.77 TRINITY_DN3645_c0_g1_i5:29-1534(+)
MQSQIDVHHRESSVYVALAIQQTIQTLVGPSKSSKAFLNPTQDEDSQITSDVVSTLNLLDIRQPAAHIIRSFALSHRKQVGFGTSSLCLWITLFTRQIKNLEEQGIDVNTATVIFNELIDIVEHERRKYAMPLSLWLPYFENHSTKKPSNRKECIYRSRLGDISSVACHRNSLEMNLCLEAFSTYKEIPLQPTKSISIHTVRGPAVTKSFVFNGFFHQLSPLLSSRVRSYLSQKKKLLFSIAVVDGTGISSDLDRSLSGVDIVFFSGSVPDALPDSMLLKNILVIEEIGQKDALELSQSLGISMLSSMAEVSQSACIQDAHVEIFEGGWTRRGDEILIPKSKKQVFQHSIEDYLMIRPPSCKHSNSRSLVSIVICHPIDSVLFTMQARVRSIISRFRFFLEDKEMSSIPGGGLCEVLAIHTLKELLNKLQSSCQWKDQLLCQCANAMITSCQQYLIILFGNQGIRFVCVIKSMTKIGFTFMQKHQNISQVENLSLFLSSLH